MSPDSHAAIAPDAPLEKTAQEVLSARLATVLEGLLRPKPAFDDPQTVHQLRVATRRADAALRLFAPLLPRRRRRRMRRLLRRLRRAAGIVRDCDVHLAQAAADSRPPAELIRSLLERRRQALDKLLALRRCARRGQRLARKIRRLVRRLAWRQVPPPPAYAVWCLGRCDRFARRFFEAASQPAADDDALHQLRILGKRLRYALELVAPALADPEVDQLLAELHAFQDRLGAVCDRRAAAVHWEELEQSAPTPARRRSAAQHRRAEARRLTAQRRALFRWWTPQRLARWQRRWQQVREGASPRHRSPGRPPPPPD